MSRSSATLILLALLIAYLALGAAYAISTPPWQAPDEPAHYNHIKYIAEHGALPVLEAGDYDQAYNEAFTRTPHDVQTRSIDPLRYENYSPPLYYILAVPFYALSDGWLIGVRIFSVLLGGALVVVAYLIGAEVFPDRLHIALGGAAFVAFVPQHVAMLSAVNSDALAELLIALCVYQALRLFRSPLPSRRALVLLGVTLGLGLLTKATVYYTALPIVTVALALHIRRYASHITQYALVFVPALNAGRAVLDSQPRRLRRLRYFRTGAAQFNCDRATHHRGVDRAIWAGRNDRARADHHVSFVLGTVRLDGCADAE